VNYFKEARINSGLSRVEAAKLLEISWFHLRNIETALTDETKAKYPSKKVLFKMEEIYECDLGKLLKACRKENKKILA
jgi:DNA-binding XRE family transcriptional regulator